MHRISTKTARIVTSNELRSNSLSIGPGNDHQTTRPAKHPRRQPTSSREQPATSVVEQHTHLRLTDRSCNHRGGKGARPQVDTTAPPKGRPWGANETSGVAPSAGSFCNTTQKTHWDTTGAPQQGTPHERRLSQLKHCRKPRPAAEACRPATTAPSLTTWGLLCEWCQVGTSRSLVRERGPSLLTKQQQTHVMVQQTVQNQSCRARPGLSRARKGTRDRQPPASHKQSMATTRRVHGQDTRRCLCLGRPLVVQELVLILLRNAKKRCQARPRRTGQTIRGYE